MTPEARSLFSKTTPFFCCSSRTSAALKPHLEPCIEGCCQPGMHAQDERDSGRATRLSRQRPGRRTGRICTRRTDLRNAHLGADSGVNFFVGHSNLDVAVRVARVDALILRLHASLRHDHALGQAVQQMSGSSCGHSCVVSRIGWHHNR